MFDLSRHATLVPGDPARAASLALWSDRAGESTAQEAPAQEHSATTSVRLVLPDGVDGTPSVTTRPAQVIGLREVLDHLVVVPPDHPAASPSVRAWALVARHALGLVARGRLLATVGASGFDEWHAGPLDTDDAAALDALAEWLPPAACSLELSGGPRPKVLSATAAVLAMTNAVADLLPRTAAAGTVSRQPAWCDSEPTDLTALRRHLSADRDLRAVLGLRVSPPDRHDGHIAIELQLRSRRDPTLTVALEQLWRGAAVGFDLDDEADALVGLRRAASVFAPLGPLLDDPRPARLELADEDAAHLLGAGAAELAAIGVEVLVPDELVRSVRAVPHARPAEGTERTPAVFDLTSLCELTWRPELDGVELSPDELAAIEAARRPLVRLRDRWVLVDADIADKLVRHEELSGADALAAALGADLLLDGERVEVRVEGAPAALAERLRVAAEPHELSEPPGLEAVLRPYQRRGLAWLNEMVELGLGGILADDMGLGKTIQLISLHLHRRPWWIGPTLVICPASVVGNWERELSRFAPSVSVRRYHGPDRTLDGLAPGDVVVTTYGILRRDSTALAAHRWSLVVADEAQNVKNPSSATAQALRQVPSIARVAMTGTPVENRLSDLWALLDWTTPGLLGDLANFRRSIAVSVERDRDPAASERLGRLLSPFLLRRRKDDPTVVPDLPPKTETDHPVQLTAEQAVLYRATVDEVLTAIASAEGIERRGLVLKLLTALKQICNHPAQHLRQGGPLAGRSGKLAAAEDLVEAIREADDSVLVFTQYVKMGELLVARFDELGHEAAFLHGGLSLPHREQMVDSFQEGRPGVFVISLKAGGTGLNLTRATHVIHFDRWWNPAVEQQASDRAWRIGQDRPVQIHQLISEGTLEDRIASLLADKRQLAERIVGGGEAWLTELDDEELAELVRLGTP